MSFLDAFIGGAAQTGMGLIDQRMRDDAEVNKMRERGNIEQQLAIARQEALREINAKMGQQVSDMADTTNRQRIADRINSGNGSDMSAEDAAAIARNPEAMKAYGLAERTRAQEMDDLATAAGRLGDQNLSKTYRDQQNVETRRDTEERNMKMGEERNRLAQAQMESRERASMAATDQRDRAAQARHDASMARIDAALGRASGGADGSKSMLSILDGVRKDINSSVSDVRGRMESELKDVFSPEDRKSIREKYEPELAEIKKRREVLERDYEKARMKAGLDPTESAGPSKKQPGQSETVTLPPQAVSKLKEGVKTTFSNGQTWTMQNGKPVKVN